MESEQKLSGIFSLNPNVSHQAVSAESDIVLLLPCNVVVREDENGPVVVAFMDPAAVLNLVDNPVIAGIAAEVLGRLMRVSDARNPAGSDTTGRRVPLSNHTTIGSSHPACHPYSRKLSIAGQSNNTGSGRQLSAKCVVVWYSCAFGPRSAAFNVIRPLSDRHGLRFQPVDATHWLNRSAGVS